MPLLHLLLPAGIRVLPGHALVVLLLLLHHFLVLLLLLGVHLVLLMLVLGIQLRVAGTWSRHAFVRGQVLGMLWRPRNVVRPAIACAAGRRSRFTRRLSIVEFSRLGGCRNRRL